MEATPTIRSGLFGAKWYYLGPLAAVYAWVTILISAWVNPWWNWTSSALSYLGSPEATDPWIYNYIAMVPTGILFTLFAVYLINDSRNRIQKLGSIFLTLGGISLVFVGIFHETAGGPGYETLHVLFSALFFLLAFLAALTWGIGLAWEGKGRYVEHGATMDVLAIGAVVAFLALSVYSHRLQGGPDYLPGAVGEVLGILVIDIWIALMFFARSDYSFNMRPMPEASIGALGADETTWISSRPSVLHAIQIRALIYVAAGMSFFYLGYAYLSSNLISIMLGNVSVINVAILTVVLYFVGYGLVIIGSARWLRVVPRPVGHILLSLNIVVPLIFVTTWFSTLGDEIMLVLFLVLGALLPLYISIFIWSRTRFALTDKRVLSTMNPSTMTPETLPRERARVVSIDQGFVQWLAGVGDIMFGLDPQSTFREDSDVSEQVEWRGVVDPQRVVDVARMTSGIIEVPHRKKRHTGSFLVAIAIITSIALILTLVPVYSVTSNVNLGCALWLSAQAIEQDPWPYVHNVTVPIGNVNITWWSGSPLWFLIIQMPKGIAYQNTQMKNLYPENQSNLTSSGSGSFTSYGGSFLMMCVATNSQTSVTLKITYSAPMIWE
jgi:hypothetical membrane protein